MAITAQKVADTEADMDALAALVNGDENADVATRLGGTVPSIRKLIKPYQNLAAVLAAISEGAQLTDGTYGDVVVSGGGTSFTVLPPEEAYGAGWDGDGGVPTKNAVFDKIEALLASINSKLDASARGAANGVAPLDATSKVPAANLQSYVLTSALGAANGVPTLDSGGHLPLAQLSGVVVSTLLGASNGVATLDGKGKVPSAHLPSYVDVVLEFAIVAAFPTTGEAGKLYVDTSVVPNIAYRWGSSQYIQVGGAGGGAITSTDQLAEGVTNLYYTNTRVQTYLNTKYGVASGIAQLDAGSKLPVAYMPASVPLIGGDGGMEVGSYLDFHTTSDGLDFQARITADASGNLSISPRGTGVVDLNTSTLWIGATGNNLLAQHDGTNGFVRAQTGELWMGGGGATQLKLTAAGVYATTDLDVGTNFLRGQYVSVSGADARIDINSRNGGLAALFYNADNALHLFWNGADRITFGSDGKLFANDIWANRGDGTGVFYLGGSSTRYLYYDNTNYNLPGADLIINGRRAATQITTIQTFGASGTVSDTALGAYVKWTTAGSTFTFNSTCSQGHSSIHVNRSGGACTISCPGGYYKNGAALATANINVPANARFTAFHEGSGVWTFDGNI